MSVDAVIEATVAVHVLLAHTATAPPLHAVAATAAFDAIEEAIAAIHVLQAHSITVLLVSLQLIVPCCLLCGITSSCITFFTLALTMF